MPNSRSPRPLAFILGGGLLVALLDIALAMGFWQWKAQVPPLRILQSISAGLLGREAFALGAGSAALGAFLHLFIACCMAAVYWFASRRSAWMRRSWFAAGLAYGALLYAAMNFVVLPLSRAAPVPFALGLVARQRLRPRRAGRPAPGLDGTRAPMS